MQCTAKKKDGTPSECGPEKVITMSEVTRAKNKSTVNDDLRCQFIKTDGHQCGGNRIKGSRFCYMHDPDPAVEKKRKRAREAGGRRSHRAKYVAVLADKDPDIKLWSLEDVRALQERTANLFMRGKINAETSRELRNTVETFLKLVEVYRVAGIDIIDKNNDPSETVDPR